MVLAMKDTGKMIYSMEEERKHGLMAHYTKETILLERSMASAFIAGMTAQDMKESGSRIRSEELEFTLG
jgi:hypothetical protein